MAISGYTTTTYNPSKAIEDLVSQFSQAQSSAAASNKERQAAIESIFDEIISRYGPGGSYGAAAEAQIERQKVRDVGTTAQSDISRGLYGIRPYGAEWEATTGAQARLSLEDIKMQRLSQAQLGKASFLENITDQYPDYNALMQAVSSMGSPSTTTTSYGSASSEPLTSLPGRGGWTASPAEGTYEKAAEWERPDIQMGTPSGPMFQSQEELTQLASYPGYSPGDTYVGAQNKDGVVTYYYRTQSGQVVPGPKKAIK